MSRAENASAFFKSKGDLSIFVMIIQKKGAAAEPARALSFFGVRLPDSPSAFAPHCRRPPCPRFHAFARTDLLRSGIFASLTVCPLRLLRPPPQASAPALSCFRPHRSSPKRDFRILDRPLRLLHPPPQASAPARSRRNGRRTTAPRGRDAVGFLWTCREILTRGGQSCLRIRSSAPFSSRETCACEIPISAAISIWVLPL